MKRVGILFWAACLSGGGCVEDHRAGQGCQSDTDCPAGQRCGIYAWCEPVVDGGMADSSGGESEASRPVEDVDVSIVDATVADGDMAAPSDAEDGWQDGACHCNGLDEDTDGQVDEDCAREREDCSDGVGRCVLPGVFECIDGAEICRPTLSEDRRLEPVDEICNGVDDNCDGIIDNEQNSRTPDSLTLTCGVDAGVCKTGRRVCRDGEYGDPCEGAVEPSTEICDGRDNDCDGEVDEDFGADLGEECSRGVGECATTGVFVCTADGLATRCNAATIEPVDELCDGLDNNCNGWIDDGFPVLWICDPGHGRCEVDGVYVCSDDLRSVRCTAEPDLDQIRPEECNDVDDDCDGETDEGFFVSNTCIAQRNGGGGLVDGRCRCSGDGTIYCLIEVDRNGGQLEVNTIGEEQAGDGQDNDCDGNVDEAP